MRDGPNGAGKTLREEKERNDADAKGARAAMA